MHDLVIEPNTAIYTRINPKAVNLNLKNLLRTQKQETSTAYQQIHAHGSHAIAQIVPLILKKTYL